VSEPLRPLVIVGAGGHAREVHQLVRDINATSPTWEVLGFAVGPEFRRDERVHGLPVLCLTELSTRRSATLALAIGAPEARRRLDASLREIDCFAFATLVHPRASVGDHVSLGEGCMVFNGCVVTTDVTLGRHVHLNTCATVSHDSRLADFTTLGPRACCCGGVHLGEGAELGAGAVVLPRVAVGAHCLVGAGAVVTKNLAEGATASGVPAKVHPCL
jgi:sugar O-acyltransferase (sialic acid O-acetyltransferase NeuD family)